MTEQNILDLITREGQPELDLNWDELTEMMQIGVALHQKGRQEFRAEIDEKALFAAPQKRRNEGGA